MDSSDTINDKVKRREIQTSAIEELHIRPILAVEGASFHVENVEVDSDESRLGQQVSLPSTPVDGPNIFEVAIGKVTADGRWHRIRYGQHENEPACMICIDVALNIGPDREIKQLFVELAVSNEKSRAIKNSQVNPVGDGQRRSADDDVPANRDGAQQHSAGILPPTIVDKGWGPELLHGDLKFMQRDKGLDLRTKVNFGVAGFSTPSWKDEKQYIEEQRWELGGMRLRDDAGCDREYRRVNWELAGKKLTRATMPRNFRLGVIVEHGGLPFDLEFRYVGSLRAAARKLDFGWDKYRHIFRFSPDATAKSYLEDLRKEELERLLDKINKNFKN